MPRIFIALLLVLTVAACGGDDKKSPPADTAKAHAQGRITSAETGAGVAGVNVTAGGASATSDGDGNYELDGITAAQSVLISFAKDGFVPQSRSTIALATADASTIVNVPMLAVRVTETFDPNSDHTIVVPNSVASVAIPAGSLRRADGSAINGLVTARVTPIAPASNLDVMPGNYLAQADNGTAAMESFGALDASFVDESGAALNLASGKTSTLRIAPSSRASDLPDTMPLFYYDTASGLWKQEGEATRVGNDDGAYYEGSVGHFTTWNCDRIYETVLIKGCVQDLAGNRVGGAVVRSEGKSYTGQAVVLADANGDFSVPAMTSGDVFVLASTPEGSQLSNARQLSLSSSDFELGEPCLTLTQAALSVKLTWGSQPRDLDSHTLGANASDHVYFASIGELATAPFLALDVDDTSGFGPEVTTFSKLAKNRTYRYYVWNYSDTYEPGQAGSPARVDVSLDGRPTVFTPPAGETESTRAWHVFDVTTDGNCQATIVPRQVFLEGAPESVNADNDAQYCD